MIRDELVKKAQAELDVAAGRMADIRNRYLGGIGRTLKQALMEKLDAALSGEALERWLQDSWLQAAARLMWLFRTQCRREFPDLGQEHDWAEAEKLLAFLLVDSLFANPTKAREGDGACGMARFTESLCASIGNRLQRLTVHDFLSTKAHLSCVDDKDHRHDHLRQYYSALDWLDGMMVSWVETQCGLAKECPFARENRPDVPSSRGQSACNHTKEQLRNLVRKHRAWSAQKTVAPNPLDDLRSPFASPSMLEMATLCRSIRRTMQTG